MAKLTARTVQTAKPGKYADGGNLYLIVTPAGNRKWMLRYTRDGKAREMGLGSAKDVSLADARERAADARKLLADSIDPIDARRRTEAVPTFGKMADDVRLSLAKGFRNEKHAGQWKMTLEVYAKSLTDKPVNEVTTADVLAVLKPIWTEKPETASRLRGRIEKVLDAAKASGYRTGENPALWRGHLDHLLPKAKKLSRGHHAALPYKDLPVFVADLRTREAMAAAALEFLILTAARTGEVIEARWDEYDVDKKIWTVPAQRMKNGKAHSVPLSDRAAEILDMLAKHCDGEFIFTKGGGLPLSNMALTMLLRRMKKTDITVHGFRSSFRDWAGEETPFPRELAEHALAHTIGDKVEQAYRRSSALERRRAMMTAWADFIEGKTNNDNVHSFDAARAAR